MSWGRRLLLITSAAILQAGAIGFCQPWFARISSPGDDWYVNTSNKRNRSAWCMRALLKLRSAQVGAG